MQEDSLHAISHSSLDVWLHSPTGTGVQCPGEQSKTAVFGLTAGTFSSPQVEHQYSLICTCCPSYQTGYSHLLQPSDETCLGGWSARWLHINQHINLETFKSESGVKELPLDLTLL